jgi:hypothetical protein
MKRVQKKSKYRAGSSKRRWWRYREEQSMNIPTWIPNQIDGQRPQRVFYKIPNQIDGQRPQEYIVFTDKYGNRSCVVNCGQILDKRILGDIFGKSNIWIDEKE